MRWFSFKEEIEGKRVGSIFAHRKRVMDDPFSLQQEKKWLRYNDYYYSLQRVISEIIH